MPGHRSSSRTRKPAAAVIISDDEMDRRIRASRRSKPASMPNDKLPTIYKPKSAAQVGTQPSTGKDANCSKELPATAVECTPIAQQFNWGQFVNTLSPEGYEAKKSPAEVSSRYVSTTPPTRAPTASNPQANKPEFSITPVHMYGSGDQMNGFEDQLMTHTDLAASYTGEEPLPRYQTLQGAVDSTVGLQHSTFSFGASTPGVHSPTECNSVASKTESATLLSSQQPSPCNGMLQLTSPGDDTSVHNWTYSTPSPAAPSDHVASFHTNMRMGLAKACSYTSHQTSSWSQLVSTLSPSSNVDHANTTGQRYESPTPIRFGFGSLSSPWLNNNIEPDDFRIRAFHHETSAQPDATISGDDTGVAIDLFQTHYNESNMVPATSANTLEEEFEFDEVVQHKLQPAEAGNSKMSITAENDIPMADDEVQDCLAQPTRNGSAPRLSSSELTTELVDVIDHLVIDTEHKAQPASETTAAMPLTAGNQGIPDGAGDKIAHGNLSEDLIPTHAANPLEDEFAFAPVVLSKIQPVEASDANNSTTSAERVAPAVDARMREYDVHKFAFGTDVKPKALPVAVPASMLSTRTTTQVIPVTRMDMVDSEDQEFKFPTFMNVGNQQESHSPKTSLTTIWNQALGYVQPWVKNVRPWVPAITCVVAAGSLVLMSRRRA